MKRLLLLLAALLFASPAAAQLSTAQYTCVGGETDFTYDKGYVLESHVQVEIDSVIQTQGTDYTWFDATTVRLTSGCTAGEVIDITRDSDVANKVVTFTAGGRLTPDNLNDAIDQVIFHSQELQDNFNASTFAQSGGHWDAQGLRIQNGSAGIADDDFVTVSQVPVAGLYPTAATNLALLRGNGSVYLEAETLPDAVAGDAGKTVRVASATALEYGAKVPTPGAGDATKLARVNSGEDGIEYAAIDVPDIVGGEAGYKVVVDGTETGFDYEDWTPKTASATSTSTTSSTGTIASFSAAVTVPSDGTWDLFVYVVLHYEDTSASAALAALQFDLERDTGGGPLPVAAFRDTEVDLNSPASDGEQVIGIWHEAGASANTHTFTVDLTTVSSAQLKASGDLLHRLIVRAERTG